MSDELTNKQFAIGLLGIAILTVVLIIFSYFVIKSDKKRMEMTLKDTCEEVFKNDQHQR